MKVLIEALLPRLVPGVQFLCVTHEGKQDLERSIPRKLRAWKVPGDRFVIVRDNDGSDCRILKEKLAASCREAGRSDSLVRIACQELEAWYFGDPTAVARGYDNPKVAAKIASLAKDSPDDVLHPSERLAEILPEFQKISGARRMGVQLSLEDNNSRSFHVFIAGIRKVGAAPGVAELGQ